MVVLIARHIAAHEVTQTEMFTPMKPLPLPWRHVGPTGSAWNMDFVARMCHVRTIAHTALQVENTKIGT